MVLRLNMAVFVGALFSPLGAFLCVQSTLVLYLAYKLLYAPYQVHKRLGIGGPKPTAFLGSYSAIKKLKINGFLEDSHKKYGSVFGFYIGGKFNVAVSDWDMIKEIMTTNNDKLYHRGMLAVLTRMIRTPWGVPIGIVMESGRPWMSGRIAFSPSFTQVRVKEMVPPVNRSCATLVEKFGEAASSQKSANMYNLYVKYTQETLTGIVFGHHVEVQNGNSSDLISATDVFLAATGGDGGAGVEDLTLVLSHFGILKPLLSQLFARVGSAKILIELNKAGLRVVKARRSETASSQDLLQLTMATEFERKDGTRERPTDWEVAAYAIDFLLSGLQPAALLMTYVSYELAQHPEIQDRVQEEIDQYFKKNPDSSLYDASLDLDYLGSVVQETLRIHPPVTVLSRLVGADIVVEGHTIPKGADVHMPTFLVHKNPEYWPQPDKFDPQRFSAEEKAKRPQLAHAPLGLGPHNCLGMRFVLTLTKMGLIAVLRRHTFVRSPETEVPLQKKQRAALDHPTNGVHLLIEPR